MSVPDPSRGWEILNQEIDKLPEHLRGEFTAEARTFEGAFTSGHISEQAYREYLKYVMEAIAG